MIQTEKHYQNYAEFLETLEANNVTLTATVASEDMKKNYNTFNNLQEKFFSTTDDFTVEELKDNGKLNSNYVYIDDHIDIKEMKANSLQSETCNYIVVSNLTEASLRAMKQDGITTATVIETGEERFQAIIKTAKAKTPEEQQKLDDMRKTLNERYGNGIIEDKIAMPGMPYDREQNRVCRTVSINAAAPVQGISRLQERIHEKDGVYTREEGQARAYAAEHAPNKTDMLIASIEEKIKRYELDKDEGQKVGYGETKSKPIFDQEEKKKEEPQQKQQEQEQTGKYEFGLGGGFLATILKFIKDLILMVINGARHAMAKMQEEKQAKEPWGDKRPYPDAELAKGTVLERGGFAKEQEQQQEKGRSVKEIIRQAGNAAREQEAQQQAEDARKRPGMMAGPTKDIDEASLSR